MTGILSNQLPGRANPPDADNPLGSFKDRTAPGANDGSYLTQTWSNDRDSILQALFIASGLTPNGVEDTGTASQLFDALVNNRWSSIGNYLPGTVVTGSDGKQYRAVSLNGRDSTVVDPTTVLDRSVWVQFPYERVENSNGVAYLYADGRIKQFGTGITTTSSGLGTVTFPVEFTTAPVSVQVTEFSATGWGIPPLSTTYGTDTAPTTTGMTIRGVRNNNTDQAGEAGLSFRWTAEI